MVCFSSLISADIAHEDQMQGVAERIRVLGRRVATVKCDVRKKASVVAAVQEAAEQLGAGPDILVTSAGELAACLEHGPCTPPSAL